MERQEEDQKGRKEPRNIGRPQRKGISEHYSGWTQGVANTSQVHGNHKLENLL